jgi:hypothetical protein
MSGVVVLMRRHLLYAESVINGSIESVFIGPGSVLWPRRRGHGIFIYCRQLSRFKDIDTQGINAIGGGSWVVAMKRVMS